MSQIKMRPGEVDIDTEIVAALIRQQFPQYSDLSIKPIDSAGTDHAMYKLGSDMVVRLPRLAEAETQVHKEQYWLPKLGPHVSLATPRPIAMGAPATVFGMHWSIYEWLQGANAFDQPISDLRHAAVKLGQFGVELRSLDASKGPRSFRGDPVESKESDVLAAIEHLSAADKVDRDEALSAWRSVTELPQWACDPVWAHGDLLPGNLLTTNGLLSAVIDFGGVGVGDPACDMMVAWTLLTAVERPTFREYAEVDDATWERGRGWALAWGLMTEHYYHVNNPGLAAVGRRTIAESLPEFLK